MFYYSNNIWRSDLLNKRGVHHGFSTREGGVSTLPHLKAMNCGFFRGEDDETVRRNIELLCSFAHCSENVVCTPQIHSTKVRYVTAENAGEGITKEVPYPCDGFVTDIPDLTLLVRTADCAPILLAGEKENGDAIVGALHAGWRGAAGGIAAEGVLMMKKLGAKNISAAIGACIHTCCYEVGEDLFTQVEALQGSEFASRHIKKKGEKLYADIAGINREILVDCGVEAIDICPHCTACHPTLYHSHRATKGNRGTMGAVISVK